MLQKKDPNAQKDAYNETEDLWVPLLSDLPAEVYALTGREFDEAQQSRADATHEVTLRDPGVLVIQPVYRFIWVEYLLAGEPFTHKLDVKFVVPLLSQRGYVKCICTEHISVSG